MPNKQTVERAKRDLREGKAPSTAAGEFVKEEMGHVRQGKHGAKSPKQAIAIGLSKARRSGVPLAPPKKGQASSRTQEQAKRDLAKGQGKRGPARTSAKRSQATRGALKRMPKSTASKKALSKQVKTAARRRK